MNKWSKYTQDMIDFLDGKTKLGFSPKAGYYEPDVLIKIADNLDRIATALEEKK